MIKVEFKNHQVMCLSTKNPSTIERIIKLFMDNFNFKQYLFESRVGMYSRAILNENELMDSETLGKEIAKLHPELIDLKIDGRTKEYQDSIFKYAGELLHAASVPLQTVRGLARDEDWAMELVSTVGQELKYGTKEDMPGFGGTYSGLDKLKDHLEFDYV